MNKFKVYSPHDNSVIAEFSNNTSEDVEKALATAFELYKNKSSWLKKSIRINILDKASEIMKGRVEELTKTAAREGGKPYKDSKVEVERAISGIKAAIAELHNYGGTQIPMGLNEKSEGKIAYTMKEPRGVVVSLSAFNHPLNLIVHQVIPAVAVGAPVIIKPAAATPMSCVALVEILYEAGLPKDWCQLLHLDNKDAEKMISDKRISFMSFIGSAKVGWMLRSKLAAGAHCALEHGGAAPVIVREDADIDKLMPAILKAGYYHAGQVCVSVQRVFVAESIAKTFAEKLASEARKLRVGDPLDSNTEVGPLIRTGEVDRIEEWVQNAVDGGAEIIIGGNRINDHYFEPTVLFNPPEDADVSKKEIFGPVVCVYSSNSLADSIKRANDVPWSFQSSIFTKDIDVALEATQKLNAVAVMINEHTAFRVDWMPFGGANESGLGMGGIKYSMEDMSQEKMMLISSDKLVY